MKKINKVLFLILAFVLLGSFVAPFKGVSVAKSSYPGDDGSGGPTGGGGGSGGGPDDTDDGSGGGGGGGGPDGSGGGTDF